MGPGTAHEPISAAAPLDARGRIHLLENDPEPTDLLADDQGIGSVGNQQEVHLRRFRSDDHVADGIG